MLPIKVVPVWNETTSGVEYTGTSAMLIPNRCNRAEKCALIIIFEHPTTVIKS